MKWYVYPHLAFDEARLPRGIPDEPSLEFLPPSETLLGPLIEQLEVVGDPGDAEYFLIPAVINVLDVDARLSAEALRDFLELFPWFARLPGQHAIFLLGDNSFVPESCRASAVFMPSCSRSSGALPMFYLAEPPSEPPASIDRAEFDASFQGTINSGGGVRTKVVDALRACQSRPVSCLVTEGYYFAIPDASIRDALREPYLRRIERSRFVFCPRGDGLSSLRFFEVLAFGRLPILVADETALPLERSIPYEHFTVRVPEARVGDWESYLDAFLVAHPDLEYCSSLARNTSRIWFSISSLGRFVERSLAERGA